MPAVFPFAATLTAPTSVGGGASAEPGAFDLALSRAGDVADTGAHVKAANRATSAARAAPARNGEAESAAAETRRSETSAQAETSVATPASKAASQGGETVETTDHDLGSGAEATPPASPPTAVAPPSVPVILNAEAPEAGADSAIPTAAIPDIGQAAQTEAEDAEVAQAAAALEIAEAATKAASSTAMETVASTSAAASVRDGSAASTSAVRRGEGRNAGTDDKGGSGDRVQGLDGASVQARATSSADGVADDAAATLLSAQMAGQTPSEAVDAAPGGTLSATDGPTINGQAAMAGSTSPSATPFNSGQAGTVHGSQLAASTIETTAQLSAQIARRLEGRSTRFDMALTPDDLGRVDVSLDIDADGSLTARLAFDNPLAATELRGRADELRRQLQDAGFTVGADSLSFSEREAGSSNGGADQRFESRAERAFLGASQRNDDLEQAVVVPAWISHSQTPQGVDLKV